MDLYAWKEVLRILPRLEGRRLLAEGGDVCCVDLLDDVLLGKVVLFVLHPHYFPQAILVDITEPRMCSHFLLGLSPVIGFRQLILPRAVIFGDFDGAQQVDR